MLLIASLKCETHGWWSLIYTQVKMSNYLNYSSHQSGRSDQLRCPHPLFLNSFLTVLTTSHLLCTLKLLLVCQGSFPLEQRLYSTMYACLIEKWVEETFPHVNIASPLTHFFRKPVKSKCSLTLLAYLYRMIMCRCTSHREFSKKSYKIVLTLTITIANHH